MTHQLPPSNFRPMLAGSLDNEADFDKLLLSQPAHFQTTYWASAKIDGIRCLLLPQHTNLDTRHALPVTRSLKAIRNKTLLTYFRDLSLAVPEVIGFDGEITAGFEPEVTLSNVFQRTTSSVMSISGDPLNTLTHIYWVFDRFYSHNEMFTRYDSYTNRFLHSGIKHVLPKIDAFNLQWESKHNSPPPALIRVLPSIPICTREQLDLFEAQCIEQGYEGMMIRHPLRPYKFGRSATTSTQQHLMKIKRFEDAEGLIIGVEELMHNDNAATTNELGLTERSSHKDNKRPGNTLGKTIVRVLTGPYAGTICKVGTGYSAALRQEIWDNPDKYVGAIQQFKYQAVGSKDTCRIPVHKAFRDRDDLSEVPL